MFYVEKRGQRVCVCERERIEKRAMRKMVNHQ